MLPLETNQQGTILSFFQQSDLATKFYICKPNELQIMINGTLLSTTVSVADGLWHHVAVTWNSGSKAIKLYKDGSLQFQQTLSQGFQFPLGNFVIGQRGPCQQVTCDTNDSYIGFVRDVRIWTIERSQSALVANMNTVFNQFNQNPANSDNSIGLQGYWRFIDSGNAGAPEEGGIWDNRAYLKGGATRHYWLHEFKRRQLEVNNGPPHFTPRGTYYR